LTPTLQAIRQKEFYTNPRFHASIGWALLDRQAHNASPQGETQIALSKSTPTPSTEASLSSGPLSRADFPIIPHLPYDLVSMLNDRHSAKLSSPKTGTFDVNEISVKIGKEICTWRLSG